MAFGAPEEDDQIPKYDPTAVPSVYQQGQPAQAPAAQPPAPVQQQQGGIPYYVAAPDSAASQSQAQAPQTAPAQPQQTSVAMPTVPTPPQMDQSQYQQYETQLQKDQQPTDRKANGPKWYDRLAGGLVGFGEGYRGDVAGGIRDGSEITTRRYDTAESDRQQRVQADQQNIANLEHKYDLSRKGFEDQVTQFGAGMQSANAQREQNNSDRSFQFSKDNAAREQGNADRDFGRATANDKFSQTRDTANDAEHKREFGVTSGRAQAELNETIRSNKSKEGIERTKANIEQAKAGGKAGAATGDTTLKPKDYQDLLTERNKEYADQQKAVDTAMAGADSSEKKARIQASFDNWSAGKQQEWNQRLAEADPKGIYAQAALNGGQPPTQGQQQAAPPAAPQQQQQKPAQPQQQQAPPNQPSKGKVSLAKALQMPINKGKTADQVRADITARGYEVGQ